MDTLGVIIGSLRKESYNRQLAELAMAKGREWFECVEVPLAELPMFNADLEAELPEAVKEFKAAIAGVDAVLVVTPEYNRSIPAVLKNALDWGSRPESVWKGKPVGIMGASDGQFGTIHSQFEVRKVMTHTSSLVMPQPQVLVTKAPEKLKDGKFDEMTEKVVGKYMAALAEWVKKVGR